MAFVSTVLITLICIAASYYILEYCRRILVQFVVRKEINLPGPSKSLKIFLQGKRYGFLNILYTLTKHYPSPFQLSLNNMPIFVIYEPNQVKAVLQSRQCLEKGIVYKFSKPTFRMGLATAPASIWTLCRKAMAPSFNPTILREFFNIFVEQSLILANKLEKVGQNGNKITFHEHIARSALDIALETMMGTKIDSKKKDDYLKGVARMIEIMTYRVDSTCVSNNFLFYDFIFNRTALGREQQKILKSINSDIVKPIIQRLRGSNKLHATRKSLFDNVMERCFEKDLTKELVDDNILTLLIMGSNTISTTLDFTVFMLANFPEVQEKVYKELKEIYGAETPMSAPVKYDDLQHMHYLERVIKETMRLFPAVPMINRALTEDTKIGETVFPKNSTIIMAFIRMYRNEKYCPNSLKFDPDRFLPERIKDCPSFYYVPFSDGPRDCLGIQYAMMTMKVILATLVRTIVFKVDESIEIDKIALKINLTELSPTKPFEIRIERRGF